MLLTRVCAPRVLRGDAAHQFYGSSREELMRCSFFRERNRRKQEQVCSGEMISSASICGVAYIPRHSPCPSVAPGVRHITPRANSIAESKREGYRIARANRIVCEAHSWWDYMPNLPSPSIGATSPQRGTIVPTCMTVDISLFIIHPSAHILSL